MSTARLGSQLNLCRGPAWRNRFMLAPLTNLQSHQDGTLSDEEMRWLEMRAEGGFGMTMTCATQVHPNGQGFPGQIALYDDRHIAPMAELARRLREWGAVSSVQLHHAGNRADKSLVDDLVGPSVDEEFGGREMSIDEVEAMRDSFIQAAVRAQTAGFDGVELHGAHGYLLAQFLSTTVNRRKDRYGGSLENRSRLLFEILSGIRAVCDPEFQVGVRLSPERFGMHLPEVKDVAAELMLGGQIDYLDLSLWDVFKKPQDEQFQDRSLLAHFADLPRGEVRLGAAGKIMSAEDALRAYDSGCDFVVIGRAGILRHDFPRRVLADGAYTSPATPVSPALLTSEGISPVFLDYLRGFGKFVAAEE